MPMPCRFALFRVLPLMGLGALAGCEQPPQGKPMDQPLEAGDALEADAVMRERAERLVEEQQRRPQPASPMSPEGDDSKEDRP